MELIANAPCFERHNRTCASPVESTEHIPGAALVFLPCPLTAKEFIAPEAHGASLWAQQSCALPLPRLCPTHGVRDRERFT